jgi:pimeloyl-ACP methyl ester carboxylesterase
VPRTQCRDIEAAWFEIGRGEPLILVHGLADDHRAWRKVLPFLALHHRVVLYDLRGHGQTTVGQADGTLQQLSGDLVTLLDRLDIQQAHLCGFSLGGTIVMRAAIDHPERIVKLVPVATSSRVGRSAAEWYQTRADLVRTSDPALLQTLEQDTRDVYANAPGEIPDGWLIRSQSTSDPRGYGNACAAMAGLNAAPLDPELERIKAPTLVIAADLDRLCPPKAAEIIVAGIAESRMAVVEGAGHPIPVERPAELASLILAFLA